MSSAPGTQGLSRRRLLVRVLGEVLVTLGALLLLFVVYQLWWTNVVAERQSAALTQQLQQRWQSSEPSGTPSRQEPQRLPLPVAGQPFALMYIPRLGASWREPVVQGVTLDDLAQGVGHYPQSALPGQIGNFAVAGHRATNGEPFAYLDQIRRGDAVVVETRSTWYVYRLNEPYIVAPTQVQVVAPVPNQPGVQPTQRLITLTTCNPRWASTERLIVHGTLTEVRSKTDGPPPELGEGS